MSLDELSTPCLLLNLATLRRNCEQMSRRMKAMGVSLRPHLKTAKSIDVARLATDGHDPAVTVSTLLEARYFLEKGISDITYAVGIVPARLPEVAVLRDRGAQINLLTDNLEGLPALSDEVQRLGGEFSLLIEIDSGGGRGGLLPDDPRLIELGRGIAAAPGLSLKGVLTHAGHSYACRSIDEIKTVAEQERLAITAAADRLRQVGLKIDVVSAGSTPTAVHAESLEGVTEMRPGVYVFQDLYQAGLGSCEMDDIALSVLARVIGHNRQARRILIDAGGLALSKDKGAAQIMENVGYGLLCDQDFRPLSEGLFVADVHQEHGFVALPGDEEPPFDAFPVGSMVRVLPNHVCMTAAAHPCYHLLDESGEVVGTWDRVNGW